MCVRTIALALVVCSTARAAPREVYFPITEDGGEAEGHLRVVLPIEERGAALAADVVAYDTGRSASIWLRWRTEWPGSYAASIRARSDVGLVVMLPHDPTARVVRIARRDATAIEALTGKNLAYVDHARMFGLDLDGDGRADVAFATVCGWQHPDGMCQGHYQLVVIRAHGTWRPARECHPSSDEPCWTW